MTDRSLRTVGRYEVLRGPWPDEISVLISPGIGGGRRYQGAFAQAAQVVYDDLEQAGVGVAYAIEDQQPDCVLLLESADWWGPVLTFGEGVISGLVGTAIYDVIKRAIGRTQDAYGPDVRAHLDIEELSEVTDGAERRVRKNSLSGDPRTVLDGLDRVLRTKTDGDADQ